MHIVPSVPCYLRGRLLHIVPLFCTASEVGCCILCPLFNATSEVDLHIVPSVPEVGCCILHCCSEPVKSTNLGCTLAYPPPADPDTLAPAVSESALSVWCRPSLFPIKTRVLSFSCLCGRVFVSGFVWE